MFRASAPIRPFVLLVLLALPAGAAFAGPPEAWTVRQRAEAAFASESWEEALAAWQRLAELDSRNSGVQHRIAQCAFRLKQWKVAVEALGRAQDLGSTLGPNMTYEVAGIWARVDEREKAMTWLRRALDEGAERRASLRREESWRPFDDDPEFRRLAGLPPADLDRVGGWRFDLDYLVAEAQRLHADPARPAFSARFLDAAADLRRRVPELDDEQIALGIQRLAALLDDGHTYFHGLGDDSPVTIDQRDLPLKFYRFSDGLFVVEASEAHADLVGARVVRFGDRPADDVEAGLAAFHGVDNFMTMRWLGVQFYLRSMLHLRALGAADEEGVTFAIVDRDGVERDVRVVPDETFELRRKLRPPADGEPPRWLRHVETSYWTEPLPKLHALYFQFNQVRDLEDGPSIAEFSTTLVEQLRATGARHLIVDLRHNNGGNNNLHFPLVRALVGWEQAAPSHRIWIVSGRNTFSAAQNFLNRMERWTDAVIVGEPSASSPNFVGESTDVELPWSRFQGSISSRYWQDSDPTDLREWIAPDLPIELSSTDYWGGRDPVLEALTEILNVANREPATPAG